MPLLWGLRSCAGGGAGADIGLGGGGGGGAAGERAEGAGGDDDCCGTMASLAATTAAAGAQRTLSPGSVRARHRAHTAPPSPSPAAP